MRNVTIVLAVAAVLALAGSAFGADLRWNAPVLTTPDDWHDAANWQKWDEGTSTWIASLLPTASDTVYINGCGPRWGTPTGAAEITGTAVTGNLILERNNMGGGNDRTPGRVIQYHGSTLTNTGLTMGRDNPVYDQKGGTHTSTGAMKISTQGGRSIYNHEGGTFNQSGGDFGMEYTGEYNMSQNLVDGNDDPILSILTTSSRVRMQGTNRFNMEGGSATHGSVFIRGTGSTYKISGGTVTTGRFGVGARYDGAPSGTGTLQIHGSGATAILVNDKYRGFSYAQRAGGTLLCEIDSGGITEIVVHTDDDDGLAILGDPSPAAPAVLDIGLLGGFTPTANQYFRLMTADTIEKHGGGLVLASGDEALWTITWGTDSGSDTLGVTYVPEPATMVLLGIGGIGVLIRRRRK